MHSLVRFVRIGRTQLMNALTLSAYSKALSALCYDMVWIKEIETSNITFNLHDVCPLIMQFATL